MKDKELTPIQELVLGVVKIAQDLGLRGLTREQILQSVETLQPFIAQERRKAKIEVLEWVYCNLPKRGDRFRNAKKTDLQEIIMGLDMDIAWEIAELKEDKE